MLKRSLAVLAVLLGLIAGPFSQTALAHVAPSELTFGSRGPAVVDIQRKLGVAADGHFGKQTLGAVVNRQIAAGIRPTGRVDSVTRDYINDSRRPPHGKPFEARGVKRAAVDKRNNIVFLIRPDGSVERWGWMIDNNTITREGVKRVSQELNVNRNKVEETGEPGKLLLYDFTRIDGGIGFHAIPVDEITKVPIHSVRELGAGTRQVSGGCIRLEPEFAHFLQDHWLSIGSTVHVLPSL